VEIHWYPSRLEQLLEEAGFSATATLRTWHDRGWLRTSEKRQYVRPLIRQRVNGRMENVYAMLLEEEESQVQVLKP